MKIVIPGGTGQIGRVLVRAFLERGDEVVVLSRGGESDARVARWDGRTDGAWMGEIDGADVVVNLAGRSVDCRYDKHNLTEMLASRIDSTRAVGRAIAAAARPPRVWLQASTATIYAHTFGEAHDEATGRIGGDEPDTPDYWRFSIEIARAWERTLAEADTPDTRKVALRMAIVMSAQRGGPFGVMRTLARCGLFGSIAGGRQWMSWVHEDDLFRAITWLIEHEDVDGVVNVAAPNPIPQRDFARALRDAVGMPLGFPGTAWMFELATVVHRTDSELLLKSRRVVPGRLLDAGFRFEHPDWPEAARDLVERARAG